MPPHPASASITTALPLPADFRTADLLAFHQRDASQTAERVAGNTLHKGLLWQGRPACLHLTLEAGSVAAELAVDDAANPSAAELQTLVRHLLGLDQPVADFTTTHRDHPELGPVIAQLPGLRVAQAASPFEALSWAITGQQISVAAAVSLRRKLILAAGQRHSSGLYCYPDAAALARLDEAQLRQAGLSRSKATTLLPLSRAIAAGELQLSATPEELPALEERLLACRGIGPWTVHYTLLRGFAHLDGSLHGDAAVRRALGRLLQREVDARATEQWLAQFRPWRALAGAYLWASLRLEA